MFSREILQGSYKEDGDQLFVSTEITIPNLQQGKFSLKVKPFLNSEDSWEVE